MAVHDWIAWPPVYRAMMKWLAGAAAALAIAAAALALAWSPWFFWALALGSGVVALGALAVWRHMGRQPMLAIEDGQLLCRLRAANSRRSANLTRVVRFPLDQIESIGRQAQPWPGASGQRHVYRVQLRSGVAWGLVPRPADTATQQAMAAFFEKRKPGWAR